MKTLVIKLAGVVDDDSLMRLGELRMSVTPVSGQSVQRFQVTAIEPITLEITGDGTFTENGTKKLELSNPINKWVEITNGTFTLSILNKEALYKLNFFEDNSHTTGIRLNLSLLRGMENLGYLSTQGCTASGTAEDVARLTNLTYLDLAGITISGDLAVIVDNLVNLTYLGIINTRIIGDTSTFGNLRNLQTLNLFNMYESTEKPMLLSQLSSLTSLTKLTLHNALRGDISALTGLTNLTYLRIAERTLITGSTTSLAALHPNNGGKLATFTYSNTGITGTWPPS